jgi:hypothetical protein
MIAACVYIDARIGPRLPQSQPATWMKAFIETLFSDPNMMRMGHDQRLADQNLGLGWLYYALGRIQRTNLAVVIGSYRGFVPAIIGKALGDNLEGGEVVFIDPAMVDDFWTDPERVARHFTALGAPNVRHFRKTTQEFVETTAYASLKDIGLLMIDGYHSAEQARFDYLSFLDKLAEGAVVMFHDSVRPFKSRIYDWEHPYDHTVYLLMERLRRTPGLEVFSLPAGDGITLVKGRPETLAMLTARFEIEASAPA